MSASGYFFDGRYLAIDDHERFVEIVDGGTNVARNEIEIFADGGQRCAGGPFDGQMLLAWFERREFRMTEHGAGGDAGVGGNAFVAGIAGDFFRKGMADDGC